MASLVRLALRLASDPKQNKWVYPLLWVFDAGLTAAVIRYIPYTEIDWIAYNQQLATIRDGERDYLKITGDTGPLVYPAGHVWIYALLSHLTSHGANVPLAQLIFGGVYLLTLSLILLTYHRVGAPPYVALLLCLSKRLHSIYVLRLFNDCFAVLGLWAAIALLQSRMPRAGALAFSVGLAVKMSVLLALPGVAVVLYYLQGPWGAVGSLAVMGQYQVIAAWPFLSKFPREYLARAFELDRAFLFKWTVNWRFVGEEVFLSKEFAVALLALHVGLLLLFVDGAWTRAKGTTIARVVRSFFCPPGKAEVQKMADGVTPDFVLHAVLGANVVGVLCARSLHYQFYSWLAWGTPYLLWRAHLHPVLVVGIWAAQEVAWNVFPSTNWSSALAVACLAVQVIGIWSATAWFGPVRPRKAISKAPRKVRHS